MLLLFHIKRPNHMRNDRLISVTVITKGKALNRTKYSVDIPLLLSLHIIQRCGLLELMILNGIWCKYKQPLNSLSATAGLPYLYVQNAKWPGLFVAV
jgi:hypothetical protein